MEDVSALPSISVPDKVMTLSKSSSAVTVWAVATGASFTAVTFTETVAVSESVVPSFTVKVKLPYPSPLPFRAET